jgi:hypothetical protein
MTVLARNTEHAGGQSEDHHADREGRRHGEPRWASATSAGRGRRRALGDRPAIAHVAELNQMYLPEAESRAQLVAGAFALLGIAASRARRT